MRRGLTWQAVMMSKKRNILVVDDERTIREVVRRYLELEGFQVTEAETGPQALSLLQENSSRT